MQRVYTNFNNKNIVHEIRVHPYGTGYFRVLLQLTL